MARRLRFGAAAALLSVVSLITLGLGAQATPPPATAAARVWSLPAGFPPPPVPADNPLTDAKIELGRHLFYDPRLSSNGTQSCSTCHEQARAFTDGRTRSLGSTGQQHPRGSMSLVNVAYAIVLTPGQSHPEAARRSTFYVLRSRF